MSRLILFNVSEYVYAGAAPHVNSASSGNTRSFSKAPTYYAGVRELSNGSWGASRLPTGGVAFMLNPIFEYIADGYDSTNDTMVFCIDSEPVIKNRIYSDGLKDRTGYKANRAKKPLDILIQLIAINDILSLVSENVMMVEGYEADDIIAELVKMYKSSYDEVIIHTRDADLYSLVSTNVSIGLVGTQGKVVTYDNFSKVLSDSRGFGVPYNGILIQKLFEGDTSDNIPHINKDMIELVKKAIPVEKYKFLSNFELFRTWVGMATNYNPMVMCVADLLIPLRVPQETLELTVESIDFTKLHYLGNKVSNKYCRSNTTNTEYEDVKEMLNYYSDDYNMRGGYCRG